MSRGSAAEGQLRVGCSGFHYAHWRGDFYPRTATPGQWFELYARRFDALELNASFYRLPPAAAIARWRALAPPGFLFAVKMSRFATHLKRLLDPRPTLDVFLERMEPLAPHLGPVLVQLPPRWRPELARLDEWLAAAPRRLRWAVEVRDRRWLGPELYALLARHGAALVLHDLIPRHPLRLTGAWTYLRFHGVGYAGGYASRALTRWAARIAGWLRAGIDVHAYFNNDLGGHAPRDALALRERVERARRPAERAASAPAARPARRARSRRSAGPRSTGRPRSPGP